MYRTPKGVHQALANPDNDAVRVGLGTHFASGDHPYMSPRKWSFIRQASTRGRRKPTPSMPENGGKFSDEFVTETGPKWSTPSRGVGDRCGVTKKQPGVGRLYTYLDSPRLPLSGPKLAILNGLYATDIVAISPICYLGHSSNAEDPDGMGSMKKVQTLRNSGCGLMDGHHAPESSNLVQIDCSEF